MSKVANEQTVTTVLHLSFGGAMDNARTYVAAHHEASISLVCSAALVMLVGAYCEKREERRSWDETRKVITDTMTEQDYKKSSIASYIQTSKTLCQFILKNQTAGEFGGIVGDILKAKTVAKAQESLEGYVRQMLKVGPKERASYQALLGALGLAQKVTPGANAGNPDGGTGIPAVQAAKGTAASIVKRIETEPAILSSIPTEKLVETVMANQNVDRKTMANRMVDQMDKLDDLLALADHVKQRIAAVKSFNKGLSDTIKGDGAKPDVKPQAQVA